MVNVNKEGTRNHMSSGAKKKILSLSGILCAVEAVLCTVYVAHRIAFSADTPVTFVISALLLVLSATGAVLVLAYTSRPTLRSIGVLALHFGMVFFLAGITIYNFTGAKYNVSMPPDPDLVYSEIQNEKSDGNYESVSLPFEMSLDSFEIVTYPDGSDKEYNGVLTFTQKRSRLAESLDISVNKPVRKNGYKIYLMGFYGMGQSLQVNLLIKRDPGEFISLVGIICMVAGAFVTAFAPERKKKKDGNAPSEQDTSEGGDKA